MIATFLWRILRPLLFRLDAENAHHFTVRFLSLFARFRAFRVLLAITTGDRKRPTVRLARLGDLEFRNRVGLAAGLDKNAELLEALPALGFGFAEIGTVTPRPQPGNPRPRLFRVPSEGRLFNRMGFNNLGADLIADHVREARARGTLPLSFRIGVNIGKNKETSADDAASDYAAAARPFADLADYLVVNVSSPNTPGLRALQTLDALAPILLAVRNEVSTWSRVPPILLKLAPELPHDVLEGLLASGTKLELAGWVLANTLAGEHAGGSGGWSGRILTERSRALVAFARARTDLLIISVGGISSAEEARERLRLGADLVQIYSALVFEGPSLPARIAAEI